jgi:formate-dependent nitrite reductase membrane component NrfD
MLTVDKLTIVISIVGQIIIPIFLKFCVKPRQTVSETSLIIVIR